METLFILIDSVVNLFSRPKPRRRRPARPPPRPAPARRLIPNIRNDNPSFFVPGQYEPRNPPLGSQSLPGPSQQPEPHRSPDSQKPQSPPVTNPGRLTLPPSSGPQRHREHAKGQRKQRLQRNETMLGFYGASPKAHDTEPSTDELKAELATRLRAPLINENRARAEELQKQILDRDFAGNLQRQRELVARAAAWAKECREKAALASTSGAENAVPRYPLFDQMVRRKSNEAYLAQQQQEQEELRRKQAERAEDLEERIRYFQPFGDGTGQSLLRTLPGYMTWGEHRERKEAERRREEEIARATARFERIFERYEAQWAKILQKDVRQRRSMDFLALPWPVLKEYPNSVEEITPELVERFVLHPLRPSMRLASRGQRILKECMRYERDNFESTVMGCVSPGYEDRARKAAAEIHRILLDLFCKS